MEIRSFLAIFSLLLVSIALQAQEENTPAAEPADEPAQSARSGGSDEGPIRLQSIFVGDKEQPAVSYFIPWQGVGTPDRLFWNVDNKHDEALEKVDRDVMLRSIRLYDEMELESPE